MTKLEKQITQNVHIVKKLNEANHDYQTLRSTKSRKVAKRILSPEKEHGMLYLCVSEVITWAVIGYIAVKLITIWS